MKLPVYNNREQLNLDNSTLKKTDNVINNIIQNLQFFQQRLHEDPNMMDTHTHMGLFESYFKELTPLVKYDSILTEEMTNRYKDIREANTEIEKMKSMLGKGVTAEGIEAKLKEYDNAFRCFYEACGFHYASNKGYTPYAIQYDFSCELEYDRHSNLPMWEFFEKKFDLITNDNTPFDIYRDNYHAELLDTDNNRKLIQDLFENNFPNCRFWEFRSRHNDFDSYSLSFTIYIPYTDIENLIENIKE